MRRLIICCDGSWQKLGSNYPTNVVKIAQAIKRRDNHRVPQVVYYSEGVGAGSGSRFAGVLGLGLDEDIIEAYTFLALNFEPGDEVFLFGFSRGAYTVRSLAGLIHCCGLIERKHMRAIPEAYEFYRDRRVKPGSAQARGFRKAHGDRIPIRVLGCWDTVGSLGFPSHIPGVSIDRMFNTRFAFHDTRINPSVQHAFHAKAIDELRKVFQVTPMAATALRKQVVEEAWFPGDHSCIGGGKAAKAPLSNRCLLWMLEKIKAHNIRLGIDLKRVEDGVADDHTADFDNTVRGFYRLTKQQPRVIKGTIKDLDLSAKRRWRDRTDYRPVNLKRRFKKELNAWHEPE